MLRADLSTCLSVLGGLLSAYALTKDRLYLEKAELLGDRMLFAFDTKYGIPSAVVNLATQSKTAPMLNPLNGRSYTFGAKTTLAEAGSVQLEFGDTTMLR